MNKSTPVTAAYPGFVYGFKRPLDRQDIPQHQKNRSNARSTGRKYYEHTKPCKQCGSLIRNTFTNKCKECAK